eukprot:TRINITY_DN43073_c0_g1_i1.p1 TRINITY_DN43073_c0_g1~~TRINITY_DN43073_c0_g1_i1.p1  ORF type:complete len:523 (-),score=103.32 TRINITY_DN43073_c0_g1_i1:169-1683(-)
MAAAAALVPQSGGSGMYSGIISSYSPTKGWGFIECEQTMQAYGKDIFVLRSEIPGGMLNKGDAVSFNVRMGEKGAQAIDVEVMSTSVPAVDNTGVDLGPYVGFVASFNPQKGWGFIESDQAKQRYGKDIFLLKSEVPGGMINRGERVSFGVRIGEKGAQAANLQVITEKGIGKGNSHSMVASPMSASYVLPPYVGIVTGFDPKKGWGFIASDETQRLYGKDVFVMKSSVPNGILHKGDQVRFTVSMGERGAQACNVQVLSSIQQLKNGPMGMMGGNGAGAVVPGMVKGGCAQTFGNHGGPNHVNNFANNFGGGCGGSWNNFGNMQTHNFVGVVKHFSEEKGWGHIQCVKTFEMFGRDVFVMRASFQSGQPIQGTKVQFSIKEGRSGPEATNVFVLTDTEDGKVVLSDAVFSGHVISFNHEKGWGFISCPEAKQIYSKDVFLHNEELGSSWPVGGEEVQFSVKLKDNGAPQATNVVFGVSCDAQGTGGKPMSKGPQVLGKRSAPY